MSSSRLKRVCYERFDRGECPLELHNQQMNPIDINMLAAPSHHQCNLQACTARNSRRRRINKVCRAYRDRSSSSAMPICVDLLQCSGDNIIRKTASALWASRSCCYAQYRQLSMLLELSVRRRCSHSALKLRSSKCHFAKNYKRKKWCWGSPVSTNHPLRLSHQ